jgi:hypothetical protein
MVISGIIQVKVTKISYIGTLFKVRFIQDSSSFRVWFIQDSSLFRVWFIQDSSSFRVWLRQIYTGFQFIQGFV